MPFCAARRGSLSPRCNLTHQVAAGGGAKTRQVVTELTWSVILRWSRRNWPVNDEILSFAQYDSEAVRNTALPEPSVKYLGFSGWTRNGPFAGCADRFGVMIIVIIANTRLAVCILMSPFVRLRFAHRRTYCEHTSFLQACRMLDMDIRRGRTSYRHTQFSLSLQVLFFKGRNNLKNNQ